MPELIANPFLPVALFVAAGALAVFGVQSLRRAGAAVQSFLNGIDNPATITGEKLDNPDGFAGVGVLALAAAVVLGVAGALLV